MSRPFYQNQSGNQPLGNRQYQENSAPGGPPTSFKTNVNRAKTKRWVEAKSYSYDGDDWGDVDDYDEYGGYDEPIAPPKPTGFRQQGQSASPTASRGYGTLARTNSFDQGDERRAFSFGAPQYNGSSNAPGPAIPQGQSSALSQTGREERYSSEQLQSQRPLPSGPTPGNIQSRPSLDSQSNPSAPSYSPPSNYRGVSYSDQSRPGYGSRAQSMTSNSSSVDFHSRRDFTPSAMPQPLSTRVSPAPRTPGDFIAPPRKSSLSQQAQIPSEPFQTFNQPSFSNDGSSISTRERTESNPSKPLPFVRPADIYRRMQEERERERQSQDSSRPCMDAIMSGKPILDNKVTFADTGERSNMNDLSLSTAKSKARVEVDDGEAAGIRTKMPLNTVAERRSEHGVDGLSDRPFLPDVTRISGFGESFLGSLEGIDQSLSSHVESEASQQPTHSNIPADTKDVNLEHQPSLGFRSMVHQAFDRPEDQIPPTPSSTAGSAVVRSDSEGTNAISPIISRASVAAHTNNKNEARENNIPIIAEEPTENSQRPTSSDTLTTPKAVTRKASPISTPRPSSSESIPPSFMPSHRRNISTPSPDNSPARSPAKEIKNGQLQYPQEAEIATATPTTPYSTVVPITRNDQAELQDAKPSSTKLQLNTNNISNQIYEAPIPALAKTVASQNPILHSQPSKTSESLITLDSPVSRADSPAKSRVRDLAGKFGDVSPTRRGSEQSLRQNTLTTSISSKLEDPFIPRPPNDRLQSFRPNLPGGWESYASVTTASQSLTPVDGNRNDPTVMEQVNEQSGPPSVDNHMSSNETNEDIDINPTTVKRTLSKAPRKQDTDGPFSAVAAAGTALAGALVAAVGMNQEDFSPPQAHEFNEARGRSASLKASEVHPEESKVWMNSHDDSASSIVSTPLAKESPQALDDSPTSNPEYFAPVVPLKQKPRNISTSDADSVTPIRPQILPSLSTDPSPQDYESDRLRKEIVRELSPHSERFEDDYRHIPQPSQIDGGRLSVVQTAWSQGHDSIGLPREYESYWNRSPSEEDTSGAVTDEPPEASQIPAIPQDEGLLPVEKEDNHTAAATVPESNHLQVRPELTHRFSWEPEPEEISATSQPMNTKIASEVQSQQQISDLLQTLPSISPTSVQPSTATKELLGDPTDLPEMYNESEGHYSDALPVSLGRTVALDSPSPRGQDFLTSEEVPSEMPQLPPQDFETRQSSNIEETTGKNDPPLSSALAEQPKIPPFREILTLKSPGERISAFNSTREQFAHMNTGLANWITATLNDLPEHASLLSNGGQFVLDSSAHKSSPSRSKLAGLRLSSIQPLQQPYYQQYLNASSQPVASIPTSHTPSDTGNASSSTHTPLGGSSGKLSKEQLRAKSKDLVHSAGVLGVKANSAAKGLFSKGKNKLRGSDKASTYPHKSELSQQETPRVPHFQPHSGGQNASTSSLGHVPLHDHTHHRVSRSPPRSRPISSLPFKDSPAQEPEKPQLSLPIVNPQKPLTEDHDIGRLAESSSESNVFLPDNSLRDQGSLAPRSRASTGVTAAKDANAISPRQVSQVGSDGTSAINTQSPRSITGSDKTPTQASVTQSQWLADIVPLTKPASPHRSRTFELPEENEGIHPLPNLPVDSEAESRKAATLKAPKVADDLDVHWGCRTKANDVDRKGATEGGLEDFSAHSDADKARSATEVASSPRISEDSHSTFQTAESGEEQTIQSTLLTSPATPKPSYFHPDESGLGSVDRDASLLRDVLQHDSVTNYRSTDANHHHQPSSSEYCKNFSARHSQDLSTRPSFDDNSTLRVHNRPPSPVSPQRPVFNRPSASEPVHHDINYDFGPHESQGSSAQGRPRSFSRPFQDPNVHEHPAFRQDNYQIESNEPPAEDYPPQLSRDEAMMPRQQVTEYQLEGVGPPTTEKSSRARSRSTSRGATFLKRLSGPVKDVPQPSPNESEQRNEDFASPVATTEKKKKRASLFRSLTGHSGNDTSPSKDDATPLPSRSPTEVQYQRSEAKTTQIVSENTAKSRGKLQRASTSGPIGYDGSKKKRFSGLGTIFGRSNQKQPSGQVSTPQSAYPILQSQQQSLLDDQQSYSTFNQQPAPFRQESAYHADYSKLVASPSSHVQPTSNSDYHYPPLEGYYSPDRRSGTFSPGFISGQRSPRLMPQSYESPEKHREGSPFQQPPNLTLNTQSYNPNSSELRTYQQSPASHRSLGPLNQYPDRTSSLQPLQGSPDNGRYLYNAQAPVPASRSFYSSWERPSNERLDNSPIAQYSSHLPPISNVNQNNIPNGARNPTRMPLKSSMKKSRGYHEVDSTPITRLDSPAPPPPPPKDDWLAQPLQTNASSPARSQLHNPPRSPSNQAESHASIPSKHQRQSLPLLQTQVVQSTSASQDGSTLTPEEIRKARQREIETGYRDPRLNGIGNISGGTSGRPKGGNEEHENIVMSGSSYPGQEWQPQYRDN